MGGTDKKWNDPIPQTDTAGPRPSFSQKRSKIRDDSRIHERLQKSLQTCSVKNNMVKLQSLLKSTHGQNLKKTYSALIVVLEHLIIPDDYQVNDCVPEQLGHGTVKGFMTFEEALSIYLDAAEKPLSKEREDDTKIRFRDVLLHPEHGLRCLIYTHVSGQRYIILDNDEMDIAGFLMALIKAEDQAEREMKLLVFGKLTYEIVNNAVNSMDTEYDRNVLKAILSRLLDNKALYNVGIRPDLARKKLTHLEEVWTELGHAQIAAEDMLKLRINSTIDKIESERKVLKNKTKQGTLSEKRLKDLGGRKEVLQERLNSNKELLQQSDNYCRQRFKQASKKIARRLVLDNRLKLRKLGAGAPVLLDSEDKEFIAKAIESKSTAHGRRHDSTLYLNHRVKFDDLLSLANYSLAKRGKKLLRSASTVYLRSRPKQLNTIEGRRHVGKWLFCTKKPPKTESHSNETTHHQRAHIKLNRIDVFQQESEFKELGVEISFDDKAYLRPGTDVGFCETKSGSIFQVADERKTTKITFT